MTKQQRERLARLENDLKLATDKRKAIEADQKAAQRRAETKDAFNSASAAFDAANQASKDGRNNAYRAAGLIAPDGDLYTNANAYKPLREFIAKYAGFASYDECRQHKNSAELVSFIQEEIERRVDESAEQKRLGDAYRKTLKAFERAQRDRTGAWSALQNAQNAERDAERRLNEAREAYAEKEATKPPGPHAEAARLKLRDIAEGKASIPLPSEWKPAKKK